MPSAVKAFIREFFHFSAKERTGVLVLSAIIVFFIVLPFFYPFLIKEKQYDKDIFANELAALELKQIDSATVESTGYVRKSYTSTGYPAKSKEYESNPGADPFYFDPNKASAADWKRLGLRDKTIVTIQKYLSKGGKFYKPDDLRKIWGLHPRDADRLIPFARIDKPAPANYSRPATKTYEKPAFVVFDVNTADTAAFIALPGIGSKLAQRIVNFRDKLGGFVSIEQVGETFGLPDSTFQKIKPRLRLGDAFPKTLNVNTATLDELKAHPYLRYAVGNAIVQYRLQHGSFAHVDELKKVMIVTDEVFRKASPYLRVAQ
jgi:DNA uptake protein ComE-like DNA-binding protein